MKSLLLFLVIVICGCSHMYVNPSKWDMNVVEPNEGIVFGKLASVTFNGQVIEKPKCTITFGEIGDAATAGGMFEKIVKIHPGQFFSYTRIKGEHHTTRFSCDIDHTIQSDIQLRYEVQNRSLNYIGQIAINVVMADAANKISLTPIPRQMDGRFDVTVEDHYAEDLAAYLHDHPELQKINAHNGSAKLQPKNK